MLNYQEIFLATNHDGSLGFSMGRSPGILMDGLPTGVDELPGFSQIEDSHGVVVRDFSLKLGWALVLVLFGLYWVSPNIKQPFNRVQGVVIVGRCFCW